MSTTIAPTTEQAKTTVPEQLPSFVQGSWWSPEAGSPVLDASTGETVTHVSTEGLDLAGAVEYARTVGQESIGRLTFHERAIRLKQLAQYLTGVKDALYAVSARTGATARDSLVDVDGGIGVLFTYGSKGRRDLPNSRIIVDGPAENLSKDNSFGGQHVYSRVQGVAFQINAYNFPVWGMLEKFAPAFLAGVPSIVKPATPTAYLTQAAVQAIVDSEILPEGALQLVSGSAQGFLDLLDLRDKVGFTGSASTATAFRHHPSVIGKGVGLTCETDSLNSSVLGPDADEGTPEFTAFIASLVSEMTSKAGQKCTAIRRAIVPEARVDAVIAAVRDRIDQRVVIGDPRADGVTMGPLASRDQRDEVRRNVQRLVDAGGEIVVGSLEEPEILTAGGNRARASEGAFLTPILLRFRDASTPAVHEIEAFGPVASVLGYSDADDAVRLVTLGGGSLVASIVSADPEFVGSVFAGIAPWHGRVHILDGSNARTSTGHGSPVPHLVHGGPGRAGGGEELGGIRAVKHYMQRTAIQGSPSVLTGLTDQWREGAPRSTSDVHPFRKPLARLRLGDSFASASRIVTLDDIAHFAEFTGDKFYAHTNEEAAAANPFFPGRVAHGYLLVSFAAGLFVEPEPGPVLANYGLENLHFITPVSPGDAIRVTLTAKEITPRETDEYGEVRWDAVIRNQDDAIVASYDVLTLVEKD